jgi:putative spermidine/putrescine transport system permease protein
VAAVTRERLAFVLLLLPLGLFLLVMVMIPFVIAVLSSVGLTQVAPGLPDGFTLRGYRDFFDPDKPNLEALWFTVKITVLSTALATLVGYALALFVKFRRVRLGPTLSLLVKLPLFTPYLVTAFMWWALLFPRGYIGIFVQKVLVEYFRLATEAPALIADPYGIGIVACSVWMRFPVVFLLMQALMDMVNPSYEEAARNLGAGTPTIIRRIYFPLTIYGLLSAVTLNFLALFIGFSIPFILGASWPQFLSVFIYVNAKDKGDWLMGYTTSVVYIAISLAVSYAYTRSLARRTQYA